VSPRATDPRGPGPGAPDPLWPSPERGAIPDFSVARLPRIEFGSGRLATLPAAVARQGHHPLLVTGGRSLAASGRLESIRGTLAERGLEVEFETVDGEPSPAVVDAIVARARAEPVDVVVGIGGGSVLDTAKAVAGLLRSGTSVRDHLEGVGPGLPYPGPPTPFVAVPTTAGTGSEATKNAVITERGPDGFKRSFRDERLVATEAIIDPDLLAGAPPSLIASNGLDAVTQLLESYVSSRASPFTDALALSGLRAARDALPRWHAAAAAGAGPDVSAVDRERMAYAALLSGICLAQAGLGVVHGLASPLGALFPVPHGIACGAVLAAGVEVNIRALDARAPGDPALVRYGVLGRALADLAADTPDDIARAALVALLRSWTDRLAVPRLSAFAVGPADLDALVAGSRGSSMRTNPIVLTDGEVEGILRASL
jgi:alcohol dehydrogenase class IV